MCDYLRHGDAKGRRPHPLFDPEYYMRHSPDVRQLRMNSLFHYVLHGAAEGRKPHPLFQPDYYRTVCAAAGNGGNPLVHFVESEAAECCNPHPLFDCASYLRAHPEASGNPLVHYLTRPPVAHGPCEDSLGTFDTARFTFQEVDVLIVFPDSGFDVCPESKQHRLYTTLQACAARDGFSGEIALVWQSASGAKKAPLRAAAATVFRMRTVRSARRANQREARDPGQRKGRHYPSVLVVPSVPQVSAAGSLCQIKSKRSDKMFIHLPFLLQGCWRLPCAYYAIVIPLS